MRGAHAREHAEHERLRLDSASDGEVPRLLHSRFGRLDPRKRTQYTKVERLKILELKARNGWTAAQTAERFLVDVDDALVVTQDTSYLSPSRAATRFWM